MKDDVLLRESQQRLMHEHFTSCPLQELRAFSEPFRDRLKVLASQIRDENQHRSGQEQSAESKAVHGPPEGHECEGQGSQPKKDNR